MNGTPVSTKKECLREMKKCKEAGKRYKIAFQTGPTSAFSATASTDAAAVAPTAPLAAADAAATSRNAPAEDAAAGAAAAPGAAAEAPTEEELAAAAAEEEEEAKRAEEAAAAAELERLKSVANGECTFIYGTWDHLILKYQHTPAPHHRTPLPSRRSSDSNYNPKLLTTKVNHRSNTTL